jgi:hypothetical protein
LSLTVLHRMPVLQAFSHLDFIATSNRPANQPTLFDI